MYALWGGGGANLKDVDATLLFWSFSQKLRQIESITAFNTAQRKK